MITITHVMFRIHCMNQKSLNHTQANDYYEQGLYVTALTKYFAGRLNNISILSVVIQ